MIVDAGFQLDARGPWIAKTVAEALDYTVDWTDWLEADTINASTWSVATGLTEITRAVAGGKATIWLKDGVAGTEYIVTNTITTNNSTPRIATQSFRVIVLA